MHVYWIVAVSATSTVRWFSVSNQQAELYSVRKNRVYVPLLQSQNQCVKNA